jgi:hypothetical protein
MYNSNEFEDSSSDKSFGRDMLCAGKFKVMPGCSGESLNVTSNQAMGLNTSGI